MDNRKFNSWLKAYQPLKREVQGDGCPAGVRGRSFTELHAYRYRYTLERLTEAISLRPGDHVLDIGPFPGGWVSLLRDYYDRRLRIDLIGLGMTPEFRKNLDSGDIRFFDFDFDLDNPACRNPGREIPLPSGRYRAVFLLETIEHLFNPLPVLRKIRESLSPDGLLLLTTDNPLWFGFSYQALCRRRSPWGPVQESHLFDNSDWRPHIRLYSLEDLAYLLGHAGLNIAVSAYFNDCFGLYSLKNGKMRYRLQTKAIASKLLSMALPDRLWANRLLVIAKAADDPGPIG
jgi:SAM-dependent methyltransferase